MKRRKASQPGAGKPRAVPLDFFLRRRPWKRALVGGLTTLLLALLVTMDHGGWLGRPADDMARYDGKTFTVAHVIDGDTLDVAAPDGGKATTRVRFWGIDTPEIAHPAVPGSKPVQPFAEEATAMTTRRAEGQTIRLRLEPQRIRDRYGRLLAYIELPDGKILNEELLAAGLAHADTRWSHRWLDRFKLIEMQAKHDKVGLWREGPGRSHAGTTSESPPEVE